MIAMTPIQAPIAACSIMRHHIRSHSRFSFELADGVVCHVMRPGPHPPKCGFVFGENILLAYGVQFFVVVLTVHRGTLGGAYHRTYPHLRARYRGWVGGMCGTFAVFISASGKTKKSAFGWIWSRVHYLRRGVRAARWAAARPGRRRIIYYADTTSENRVLRGVSIASNIIANNSIATRCIDQLQPGRRPI